MKKPFLITVDTEGDNLWSKPVVPAVENSKFIGRFQSLCDDFGFRPTYLANYEMARAPEFVRLAREAVARGAAEVGCHIHAWDSPPFFRMTDADHIHHPYLIEYPDEVIEAKVRFQTDLLEGQFGCKIVSHRAGRWAFDQRYARILEALDYRVDCSVTPGVSWRAKKGLPSGEGGTDYREFPREAYYIDLADISRPGNSRLLEVPMTIQRSFVAGSWPAAYRIPGLGRLIRKVSPEVSWLRPQRGNFKQMNRLVKSAGPQLSYLEFMIHSSELMPGGSPYFPSESDVDRLYSDLRKLFRLIAESHRGMTLSEFADGLAAAEHR